MSDKYRINPDFVAQEPTAANFFCTVSEEEFTDEFRQGLMGKWRRAGVKQMRVTIINDEYPNEPYPHGVWVEGWTDENARMLPFGEAEKPGGAIYPPLVAASCDTHPKDGDVKQAPLVSGAVPKADAQTPKAQRSYVR